MLEKFLLDYVEAVAEANEVELTRNQMVAVVNNMMLHDDVWEYLDSVVWDEINFIRKEK